MPVNTRTSRPGRTATTRAKPRSNRRQSTAPVVGSDIVFLQKDDVAPAKVKRRTRTPAKNTDAVAPRRTKADVRNRTLARVRRGDDDRTVAPSQRRTLM